MTATPPALAGSHKDRKTALIVFGVFQIAIGGFFTLSLLVTLIARSLLAGRSGMPSMDGTSFVWTLAFSGGMAATLITIGIGCIRARRWARALSLCLSWMALIAGIYSCAMLGVTMPQIDAMMRQQIANSGQAVSPGLLMAMKVMMVATTVCFEVVIPAVFVLFFRSRHVKATCEARDPVVRWTDRCPLPVLAMVLMEAFGAAAVLFMLPTYGRVFPLLGVLIEGWPARLIYLGLAAVSVYVARGLYRLDVRAWWLALAIGVLFGINSFVDFAGGRLLGYYEALHLPDAQMEQLRASPLIQSPDFAWGIALSCIVYVGFLAYLRRYFRPGNVG